MYPLSHLISSGLLSLCVCCCLQVVQQQQQLQMSFAWSFLHVGQSMTANLFHSISAVSGPKAARRLSERIVGWAFCSCILLACGTFTFRCDCV